MRNETVNLIRKRVQLVFLVWIVDCLIYLSAEQSVIQFEMRPKAWQNMSWRRVCFSRASGLKMIFNAFSPMKLMFQHIHNPSGEWMVFRSIATIKYNNVCCSQSHKPTINVHMCARVACYIFHFLMLLKQLLEIIFFPFAIRCQEKRL